MRICAIYKTRRLDPDRDPGVRFRVGYMDQCTRGAFGSGSRKAPSGSLSREGSHRIAGRGSLRFARPQSRLASPMGFDPVLPTAESRLPPPAGGDRGSRRKGVLTGWGRAVRNKGSPGEPANLLGHGSACVARQRERQIEFHPVVHDLRRDAAPLAAFESDQAVTFHGPQRAGEVGLRPSR